MVTAEDTRKILIVDDEQFILDAVASMLATAGFETHTCHLWAGVANTVRNHEPDLILLDYNMPGLRGDDICAILKRNATGSRMKIILFSAEDESDLIRITASCGADGYIRKNTPAKELLRLIGEALGAPN
jgi:DNA-binding response OmpR family regulator